MRLALAPLTFGLDVSGTIEAVGEHVLNLSTGDRVYVDPFITCGTCAACRKGKVGSCPDSCLRGYFAFTDAGERLLEQNPTGGFSEYVVSRDTNIAILPSSIDLRVAARFGYLGTSFSALKKAHVGPGSTLVVNGVTGTLGYGAVATALALGCVKILGIGRNQDRLAQIKSLSPDRIHVCSSEEEDDVPGWIKKHAGGSGPDALYDCLGVGGDANVLMSLIHSVRRGGTAVLAAGGADGNLNQTYMEAMMSDIAVRGTMWFSSGEIDEMIALVGAGVMDLSFLEHVVFELDRVNEALEYVGERPGGATNVLVRP